MRLLSKTSLLIITVSIFIFLTGNIVFFYVLKHMINNHVTNDLFFQMHKIINEVNDNGINSETIRFSKEISIQEVNKHKNIEPVVSDTVLYNDIQKKYTPYKFLRFYHSSQNETHKVTIYKSLLSSNKLIERITIASIFLVLSFLFAIYTLNRFIFVNVWSNFFENLKRAHQYNINSRKKLLLEESEIDEFNKLNSVLKQMVGRIQKDFTNLKELTENTSHEIQTPLAIIKSKAELLLQSDNISESDIMLTHSILDTSERLSKLNQSLLIISKIENNQFELSSLINVKNITEKYINNFDILFKTGNFKLSAEMSDINVNMNPLLLDVLVSNLLKNAVLHGEKGGEIKVLLKNNLIGVYNSGKPLEIPPEEIFKRFVKRPDSLTSSGLGLEIVKKICDYYNMIVRYGYANRLHSFTIDLSSVIDK
ncbi:MAG: HAMP domain-containing histidine kinase [Bacteroidales bacterium]|nr:HAMP domain-containing histidine kinase [Bacteroidales bacterium]